jgi:hypothetical protein
VFLWIRCNIFLFIFILCIVEILLHIESVLVNPAAFLPFYVIIILFKCCWNLRSLPAFFARCLFDIDTLKNSRWQWSRRPRMGSRTDEKAVHVQPPQSYLSLGALQTVHSVWWRGMWLKNNWNNSPSNVLTCLQTISSRAQSGLIGSSCHQRHRNTSRASIQWPRASNTLCRQKLTQEYHWTELPLVKKY